MVDVDEINPDILYMIRKEDAWNKVRPHLLRYNVKPKPARRTQPVDQGKWGDLIILVTAQRIIDSAFNVFNQSYGSPNRKGRRSLIMYSA